ncbi:MAG: type III toxin-antitoxin system ToxN/AbiQ family toxin [Treponema sp.]|nr:type III toxin-antitoxin system ToxN/AbiQ family toxin [Treponema sp.]
MSYKFVIISDKYIEYLRKSETRVMSNKINSRIYHRKYLGIIEKLNGFNYFIPLSSPKTKDYTANGKIKNDSLITIYMKDTKRLFRDDVEFYSIRNTVLKFRKIIVSMLNKQNSRLSNEQLVKPPQLPCASDCSGRASWCSERSTGGALTPEPRKARFAALAAKAP